MTTEAILSHVSDKQNEKKRILLEKQEKQQLRQQKKELREQEMVKKKAEALAAKKMKESVPKSTKTSSKKLKKTVPETPFSFTDLLMSGTNNNHLEDVENQNLVGKISVP